jgi:predicted RNA-binding Zn-ribbon protein involved in translation (DUF1610 family)
MSDAEIHTVTDENGVEKQMIGRATGLKRWNIPTGNSDLDWRCPNCGEIGFYRVKRGTMCTNRDCRVNQFSPFVQEADRDA